MKMHDRQSFKVDGVAWQFRNGQMPQGTLHAVNENKSSIAMIQPKDWSKPIWAEGNAVLMTRKGAGNEWTEHKSGSVRDAVRGGTTHVKNYARDREIAAMEHSLKSGMSSTPDAAKPGKTPIKASGNRFGKPLDVRKTKDLKEWIRRTNEVEKQAPSQPTKQKNQGMEM